MAKTLINLVKQECANYVNSECIGVDLMKKMFNKTGVCWIVKDKKSCEYFKRYVLPLELSLTGDYNKIDSSVGVIEVKRCKCGEKLEKFKQYCSKCSKKKYKDRYRKYNTNR